MQQNFMHIFNKQVLPLKNETFFYFLGEFCRSLPVLSTEQTELFKSIDKTIEQTFPKDSLVGDIFEVKGLTPVGREIKSLSKEIPVLQNPAIYQRSRGFKPGAVLILEVEVSKENGEVKCNEKVIPVLMTCKEMKNNESLYLYFTLKRIR